MEDVRFSALVSMIEYDEILPKSELFTACPRCPGGSKKLRFPDNVTKAQNGGKVVSLTHRPFLTPENTPGNQFC